MRIKNKLMLIVMCWAVLALFVVGCQEQIIDPVEKTQLKKFQSGEELLEAFENANDRGFFGYVDEVVMAVESVPVAFGNAKMMGSKDFSTTNIQVKGVDEADIIKTDGKYIYAIANGKLIIAKAHPDAEILSETELNLQPQELFIHGNRLMMFGYSHHRLIDEYDVPQVREIMPYPRSYSTVTVKLFDISDKEDPEVLRTVDFEGQYLTSRMIDDDVYFVVNSYPQHHRDEPTCETIIPQYKENGKDFEPIVGCTDIGYIEPIQAQNFITIASISITNEYKEVEKEVIVGSGQNIYASLDNLYIAQTQHPRYNAIGKLVDDYQEKTVVTKFSLKNGKIQFSGTGSAPGHILNQFSMDEHDGHFRIATTKGNSWGEEKSTNNVYVLNSELDVVGKVEDLAPGESIYSVRFMGKRAYVVTFKKVDPLFVIDLSNPSDPSVLGKLKIPGYSDYLHPYDENHIIGIGKDTVEAAEELKTGRNLDFAWYQGVKMAIFDVSDVENPIEMHKVIIGDRGTDSEALRDHKAFLFDREKGLLVIPVLVAKIEGEKTRDNQYGDYIFQGAYVFDVGLKNGFELRGKVTHYDDDSAFKKSRYYFGGDSSIRRSLYIEDVLYTFSNKRLQLNNLDSLERMKVLEFSNGKEYQRPDILY